MEEEFEFLKNPFEGLSNYESIQDKCAKIAHEFLGSLSDVQRKKKIK